MHELFFKHEYLLHVDDTSLSVNNLYNLMNQMFTVYENMKNYVCKTQRSRVSESCCLGS